MKTLKSILVLFALMALFVNVVWGQNVSATWGPNGNTAWWTAINWAGSKWAGIKSSATSNSNIATFTSAFTGTTPGINMNTSSISLGAISIDNTRTTALNIGNSSATGGTMALYGATINSVNNVIISNNGTGLFTLQANQAGAMGVVLSNATNNIINIDNTGGVTISSIISGTSMNLTKAGSGSGILTLTNSGNTYSGATTITTGELRLNPSSTTATFASQIVLNGGKLSTTSIATGTTITSSSTLNLNAVSTIDLGSLSHSLKFANSKTVTWNGTLLTINGWTGTAGSSGLTGKIFVGTDGTGLDPSQLSKITFTGYSPGAQILSSTGEVVPIDIAITLSSPNPSVAAGNITKGSPKNLIYKFNTAVANANATINSVAFTTAGAYASGDVTKFQLWYYSSDNFGSATQIGSDITTTLGNGSHTFSSLTQTINSGTTGYFYITTDVSISATTNNTINVSAITTSDLTFASGTKSGTAYAGSDQTIIVPTTPDILLASPNPSVAAGNVMRGSTKNLIYKFNTAISTADATISSVSFTTDGTYSISDVSKYQLWYKSGSDDFSTAVQIGTDITTSLGKVQHIFSSLTQGTTNGTTGYFYITTDFSSTATPTNNINVVAITTGDLTYVVGNKTGTAYTGNSQTILTPDVSLSSNSPAVSSATLIRGDLKKPAYRFVVTGSNGATQLTQVNFTSGGAYIAGDIVKFQLYYSSADNLSGAAQIGSDITGTLGTGTHSFTGLSTSITNSIGYFWIAVDISSSSTPANVLNISAIATGDLTFNAANITGSTSTGGDQTIATPTITLSSSNPSVPAAKLYQSTLKNGIYNFTLTTGTTGQSVLNRIDFSTTGTYASTGDVTKFQLWYSSSNSIGTAVQIGSDITGTLGVGSHTFSGLTQTINNNAAGYFWITTDVGASPVIGSTLTVSAISTSNITFNGGNLSGTAYDGGLQTIAQAIMTFRSKATGNWNATGTWESSTDLSSWVNASSTPGANNTVYIQSGHTVTLTQNEACLDLHIAKGITNADATNGKVNLATYTLQLNGKLRTYYAAVGTVQGTSTTTMTNMIITKTAGGTGKLQVVGNSRALTSSGEWAAGSFISSTSLFSIEINLNTDQTITLGTNLKAQDWTVTAGTLDLQGQTVSADYGTGSKGDITVASGAVIISNMTSGSNNLFQRTGNGPGGTLTINGTLKITGTVANIQMSTIYFNGTVEYNGTNPQTFAVATNGGANPNTYTNLVLSGSGAKTLAIATTLNGTLTMGGTASLSLGGFVLTYGGSSILEYAGTSAQVTTPTELPTSSGPNGLKINNSLGVSLGGSASIAGNLNLTSGLLTLSSNNLTLGSSSSISGNTPSASNMVVADGTGQLIKSFSVTGSFTFPVGDNTGTAEYSPATVNFTAGTFAVGASLGVNLRNAKDPNTPTETNYLFRYWDFTNTGISSFSCDVTLNYIAPADVTGNEALIYMGHYSSGTWTGYNAANVTNHTLSASAVTSFSRFTGGDQSVMPVRLASFNSNVFTRDIKLKWVTESESNNQGFEILRSAQNDNGGNNDNNWNKIAFVNGKGNSLTASNYEFTDSKLTTGKYKYRLKQIDFNGNFEYFDLSGVVEIGVPVKFNLSQNYPNPFNPTTKIDFDLPLDSKVSIKVFDISGKEVSTLVNEFRTAGYYTVSYDASALSSGVYFYRIMTGDGKFVMTKKLLLLK